MSSLYFFSAALLCPFRSSSAFSSSAGDVSPFISPFTPELSLCALRSRSLLRRHSFFIGGGTDDDVAEPDHWSQRRAAPRVCREVEGCSESSARRGSVPSFAGKRRRQTCG